MPGGGSNENRTGAVVNRECARSASREKTKIQKKKKKNGEEE